MALEAPITKARNWHRFERKTIDIAVNDAAGDPVALVEAEMRWLLLRQAGGTILLEKLGSGADLNVVSTNVARIEVREADYDAIAAGVYWHELWNKDTPLLLAYGDAWLLQGTDPDAVP